MDVIELLDGLYFLRFPIGHAYVWEGTDGLTLIDTGLPGSAPAIAEALRGLGHSPTEVRRVVLTHAHFDHTGSAAEIAAWGQAAVYAHRAEAPAIRGAAQLPGPNLEDWERPIHAQVAANLPPTPPSPEPVQVSHELDDGDVIDLGGTSATALSVPGHTPGSLALFLPGPGVLFAGDTIARTSRGEVIAGVFNIDPAQTRADFRRLAALDVETACFGHGEPAARDAATELRAAARLPA